MAIVDDPRTQTDNVAIINPIQVLLDDDDHIMHRVTTLVLNDLGIRRVQSALSGQQALDILDQPQHSIDIVICDLHMPEMGGIEFTCHLSERNYSGSMALLSGEDTLSMANC